MEAFGPGGLPIYRPLAMLQAIGQDILDYEDPDTPGKLRLFTEKQEQLKQERERVTATFSNERVQVEEIFGKMGQADSPTLPFPTLRQGSTQTATNVGTSAPMGQMGAVS